MKKQISMIMKLWLISTMSVVLLTGLFTMAQAQMGRGMMMEHEERNAHDHPEAPEPAGMGMKCPKMERMGKRMESGMDMMISPRKLSMLSGMGMMVDSGIMSVLNEEQLGEVRAMQIENRRKYVNDMLDLVEIHEEMTELMSNEEPDPRLARELHDRKAAISGDMLESRIEMRNRIYNMLTEDQRRQLREERDPVPADPGNHVH